MQKTRKYVLKALKIISIFFGSLLGIISIIFSLLFIPKTQKIITNQVNLFIVEKLGNNSNVGEIKFNLLGDITLTRVFVADSEKDTLLFSNCINAHLYIPDILNKKITITDFKLNKSNVKLLMTSKDSLFNFNYIIKAFSSKGKKTEKINSKPIFTFSLDRLNLEFNDVNFSYMDSISGIDLKVDLGNLKLKANYLNDGFKKIALKSLSLKNTKGYLNLFAKKYSSDSADTASGDFNLIVNLTKISDVNFKFNDQINNQVMSCNVKELELDDQKFDLKFKTIFAEKIFLSRSNYSLVSMPSSNKAELVNDEKVKPLNVRKKEWEIKVSNLTLKDNSFKNGDNKSLASKSGIDYSNLDVSAINTKIEKIEIYGNEIMADVKSLSLNEKSGFKLKHLSSQILFKNNKTSIKNLKVETPTSSLNVSFSLKYNAIEDLFLKFPKQAIDFEIYSSHLLVKDLELFIPDSLYAHYFSQHKHRVINLKTSIKGKLNDFYVYEFEANAAQLSVNFIGKIKGIEDIKTAFFDIQLKQFKANRSELFSFIGDSLMPEAIVLPESFQLSGTLRGGIDDFITKLQLNSTLGSFNLYGAIKRDTISNVFSYEANLKSYDFDIGKLINNKNSFGKLTISLDFKGKGFRFETMDSELRMFIEKGFLNGYEYKNISLNASIDHDSILTELRIDDPNVQLFLIANALLSDNNLKLDYKLILDTLDFQKIYFSDQKANIKLTSQGSLIGNDIKSLKGQINVLNLEYENTLKSYLVNQFIIKVSQESGTDSISIISDFLNAGLYGKINIFDLPESFGSYYQHYFSEKSPIKKNIAEQDFNFFVKLSKTEIISELLLPGITFTNQIELNGNYNSSKNVFECSAKIPELNIADYKLDSITVNVNSDTSSVDALVFLKSINKDEYFIRNVSSSVNINSKNIDLTFSVLDSLFKERFSISTFLTPKDGILSLKIKPAFMILNYQKWLLPDNNQLDFGRSIFSANNFKISRDKMFLSLNSENKLADSPLKIEFGDFDIGIISKMIDSDNQLFSGVINGQVIFQGLPKAFKFASDIAISNFCFQGDTLGDFLLKALNVHQDNYDIHAEISGKNNLIKLDGVYKSDKKVSEAFDFKINIERFNLNHLQAFTSNQINELKGFIKGKLHLQGNIEKPIIVGEVTFNETRFELSYLKADFFIDNQKIYLSKGQMAFNNFILKDKFNNQAIINGELLVSDFSDLSINWKINLKNFIALNTNEKDNKLYFGKLLVDSDIHWKGTFGKPEIKANIKLLKSSDFTMIIPQNDLEQGSRDELISFFDADTLEKTKYPPSPSDTIKSGITGIDINANVEIDKEVVIKIIVDKQTGDKLEVKGNAIASFSIDPGGNISLTGRYDIEKGSYKLSFYEYIKKEFIINKGSYISWTGDPLNADININASYAVLASAYGLMENETEMDAETKTLYRKKLPFNVSLNIKDKLSAPTLSFSIDLPEDQKGVMGGYVNTRLQQLNNQETELNKQVFGLLIFNSFIPQNPLNITASQGFKSTARSSASKILTQQLNALSGRYIKGLDINFAIQSYETALGNEAFARTDMQVALSKQIFNEKVKVQFGSDIPIEGYNQQQSDLSDLAGDLIIEYKIDPQGKYLVKGYRQKQFQNIIDGEFIETGVSIIYAKEYDLLREIFYKNKK